MNTLHTEEYYEINLESIDRMRGTINPEKELEHKLSCMDRNSFPDEQWSVIESVFAKQVVEETTAKLLEDKKVYIRVRNNPDCLGYTTQIQTTKEAHRIITVFEYNCYKLKQFKQRYSL